MKAVVTLLEQMPPEAARPPGLDERACPSKSAHHEGVLLYLKGIATSKPALTAKGAFLLNASLRCMSAREALRLNTAFARALGHIEALPTHERRMAAGIVVPLVLIQLDATKHAGNNALMRHVLRMFSDYAAVFSMPGSAVQTYGVWLPAAVSWDLSGVRSFCELSAKTGCVSGHALLRAVTDPLAIGLGDCGLVEAVEGGLDALGAYSCRKGVCAASAVARGANGARLPRGLLNYASEGLTPYGISVNDVALTLGCARGGPGAAGGTPAAVLNGGRPRLDCVVDRSASSSFSCIRESVTASSGVGELMSGAQPSVPTGDLCTTASGASTSPGPASAPTAHDNDSDVKKAKEEVARNLEDPVIQNKVIETLQGTGQPDERVRNIMVGVAASLRSGSTPVHVVSDGDARGIKAGGVLAVGYTDYVQIVIDYDFAKSSDPSASGSLGNILMHEALHVVFGRLGLKQSDNGGEHHSWMMASGITWATACKKAGDPGCEKLCGADTDCASRCTAVSLRMKQFLKCMPKERTPRVPQPVDPSPLEDSAAGFAGCSFPATAPISLAPNCMLVRCMDGTPPKLVSGRCVCGGDSSLDSARIFATSCGALDCAGKTPVVGPGGCSCQDTGATLLMKTGEIIRRWGTRIYKIPVGQ
ncbi:hypothetical protein D7V93_42090 [Corallococcus llansteffanensis]|uniref:Uncharacterized protein n=2 Tax=Corallococcus llansteffanensis TaxID=2316731 RepID=A0A3A8N563_9BACT|nr:hypothetical protein D7V93_42090 [Corallococcus llansteffanensis]